MMKPYLTRLLFPLLFFGLSLSPITAQEVDPKLAEILQHTLDSMRQLLNINGLSAAIQMPNDAVWAGGSGVSTFSPIDSISPSHVFATGSSTKTVTAACILQLVDEGVLKLDDSLHQWVPNFNHINPNITIRQLLRHQSGLYDVLQNSSFQPTMLQDVNELWSLETVINTFIQAPNFPTGTSWQYSNTNYLLLGMIIESATGNAFHEEISQRFFDPLGLESFINLAYDPLPAQVAHLWLDLNGDGVQDDAHNFFTSWKSIFSAVGPAGGYFATPSDLAKWMKASMSGSLHSESTWAEATELVNTSLPGGTQYGLGLTKRQILNLAGYGHGGDLSYSTLALYFPEKEVSIAVQANDSDVVSWNLASPLRALLQVYLECEPAINATTTQVSTLPYINITPNPFDQEGFLDLHLIQNMEQLSVQIVDVQGRQLWHTAIGDLNAGTHQIDLQLEEELPVGFYIIQLRSGGRAIESLKMIVR